MTDPTDRDAVAPERIWAWPGSYPRFENDDWMNASCRSEYDAGPGDHPDTLYVRADHAEAEKQAAVERYCAENQAMREALIAFRPHEVDTASSRAAAWIAAREILDGPMPHAALDRAIEAEREACAKVAEEFARGLAKGTVENIAAAIRARSDKGVA